MIVERKLHPGETTRTSGTRTGPSILFVSYTATCTGPTNSLVTTLRELRDAYELGVVLPGEGPAADRLRRTGVRVHSFSTLSKWSIPRLVRLVRGRPYDLVYANNTHGSSRNAAIAAALSRVPFICHVRGIPDRPSWSRYWYLRTADAVVAVSGACAIPMGRFVGGDDLHVVHNGVSRSFMEEVRSQNPSKVRGELGLSDDAIVISSLGHIKPGKGHEYAIRALRPLVAKQSNVHLLIAGKLDRDPQYLARLNRHLSEWSLEDNVHILGFRSDVPALLAASDLYLHASLSEAHPRSVLEAMAAGLPVVAFAVGGVTETVSDGVTGRLVPSADHDALATAVIDVLEDPGRAARMGEAGIRDVERRFTAEATAEGVRRVIDAVLERSGGKRVTA